MSTDDEEQEVDLVELVCTCVKAAQLGCDEIRRVHSQLKRTNDGDIVNTNNEDQTSSSTDVSGSTVDYKIANDPRSALTAADLAAQLSIVGLLQDKYPTISIVGEEDMACEIDESDAAGGKVCASDLVVSGYGTDTSDAAAAVDRSIETLKQELYLSLQNNNDNPTITVSIKDVTIFVDPLDGTREFVEGRVYNVQSLIGIAVKGYSVAGAVGLPFAMDQHGNYQSGLSAVVCALEGAGPPRVIQQQLDPKRAHPSDPIHGGGIPSDGDRPLLVSGDVSNDVVLEAAYAVALSKDKEGGALGRSVLLGGTGQKCLAVAEDRADIAIMNFLSSSWDTCAPEALVRASGGHVTDIFGQRIIHAKNPQLPPLSTSSQKTQTKYLNLCGVIASSNKFIHTHNDICNAMKQNNDALSRCLQPWGLFIKKDNEALTPTLSKEEVELVLTNRRETQLEGI